jgi:hypothetical protein
MPPHLQLTLLNVPSSAEGAASLPRPQHVILNHIYIQRGQVSSDVALFGGVLSLVVGEAMCLSCGRVAQVTALAYL